MTYPVVKHLSSCHSVHRICAVLGVSRSGYYAWRDRPETLRAREDRHLRQRILSIHTETKGRYGTPRIERSLRRQGVRTSRKRVARLRRELGLRARTPRRYRVTTDSRNARPPAPNLLKRCFAAPAPDRTWVGDITYLSTSEGWLYLALLMDTYSRRVVGWSVSPRINEELPLAALRRALTARRPPPGLVHHSDRGAQYCGLELPRFGRQLRAWVFRSLLGPIGSQHRSPTETRSAPRAWSIYAALLSRS